MNWKYQTVFWEIVEEGNFSCGMKAGIITKDIIWLILC